ncbi:hypothetical protein [Paenibacillus rigui]|uniref:Bypass of forespore C C-terminal domain-containing protein n=1 Tax=Paenibacillus rigui TaxID=554312 RepID=A0A229UP50_9BACL|nr:hypothetical protein [Paenibacillus rigui]OXM85133.1 hypothetical protein CF651_16120 [Paenibacillus rigui]
MVKNWKNTAMAALMLALALGSGGAASAQTADGQQAAAETKSVAAVKAIEGKQAGKVWISHAFGMLGGPVHEQQYIKLLVKAYAPETGKEWAAALEERKSVEQKLAKPILITTTASQEQGQPADEKQQLFISSKPDTLTSVLPEKTDAESVGEAEGTTDPMPDGTLRMKRIFISKDAKAVEPDMVLEDVTAFPAEVKLNLEFTKAVEAEDAAALKTLLPQLLEQYKQQTAELSKAAEAQADEQGLKENQENK